MTKQVLRIETPDNFKDIAALDAYVGINHIGRVTLSRSESIAELVDIIIDDYDRPLFWWFSYFKVRCNYRGKGYGSLLLREAINFCQAHQISQIKGEAKGDLELLLPWYKQHGFDVDSENNIRLYLRS